MQDFQTLSTSPAWARRANRFVAFCLVVSFQTIATPKDKRPPAEDELFGSRRVLSLNITVASNEVESLQREPRKRVRATVMEGGQSYTNVALSLKGLGSFQPITEKPSFSIKFDENEARFYGHSRILLENSSQDSSFVRRKLTSELYLKEGIPAARVTYATVRLNGRDLGLYTLSEAMNKDFLKRHFRSNSGNLYEGSDEDISGKIEQDSGKISGNHQEIQALVQACAEPNLSKRWTLLRSKLDVDRFITFMALEVLICHHDGYSMDLNNYRLYHDPATGRIVFIPHGMDLVFNRPTMPIEPQWRGLVAIAVMETREGREQYRQRMRQLAQQVYGDESLERRVDELANFLRAWALAERHREEAPFDAAVATIKGNIRERSRFVLGQLAPMPR